MIGLLGPAPNGAAPVAANAITLPRANTSLAGPTGCPSACSGDMNAGVPTIKLVMLIAAPSSAREIPKSISRGPSAARSTLAGLRSRCTRPPACTACSASIRPPASLHTAGSGRGPVWAITSASDGPGTKTVASQGGSSPGPAATTGAVNAPLTTRAASTSRLNRRTNSGSRANCRWMTFTATARPAGEKPRKTWPIPPAPSRACSRYPPTSCGSSAARGSIPAPAPITGPGLTQPSEHRAH